MKKIKIGITGGAGYTGGELIRILINHPAADIVFVQSKSNAGKTITHVHTDLAGETALEFSDSLNNDIELLFLCLGHGEAKKFLQENNIPAYIRIIDLSQDFRLAIDGKAPLINDKAVIYGLPEWQRSAIQKAFHIANPGCFATAIQLGLLPLAKAGLLEQVFTTGITGSTGAGQGLSPTSHFSWRTNNIQAYKTLTHQHTGEIHQTLKQLQPSLGTNGKTVQFVPWRGDFARGIFISSQIKTDLPLDKLHALYEDFYQDHPFTFLSKQAISMKQAVNTNKCVIQLEKEGDTLVVHSALDNLLKGASGQAVQNMNLMFGLDEGAGLKLKASAF